jgi:hypothetical protein
MLARSRDNSILRRRSAGHNSGKNSLMNFVFMNFSVFIKGDAQLPSDSSPLTDKMGLNQ